MSDAAEGAFDRYRPRSDVRDVPPQGGDAAKRCPLRVQFDVYPPVDVERAAPSAVDALRTGDAASFTEQVFARLLAAHPDAVRVATDRPAADRVAATLGALAAGAPLVLGARLPTDESGRRRGPADGLVRAERRADGRWAYHPLAVRHRQGLEPGAPHTPEAGALVASLAEPGFATATRSVDHTPRTARSHLLLLAHFHRVLEASGHGSAEPAGAVVGKEVVPVWHRLDVPSIRQRWDKRRAADETALERYDFEFSFRLDVLAAAAEGTPIVEPVWIPECTTCPWVGHCRPLLVSADSVSLLPGIGYEQWRALRRQGIATRAELAALDLRSALVRDAYAPVGDLADAVGRATGVAGTTPLATLLADPSPTEPTVQERQAAVLEGHGVTTAADLLVLDPVVVGLAGQPLRSLADAVQGARAVVHHGGQPQLRAGTGALAVPSADVEIDIDMENGIDGAAYLWGAWLHDGYHASVSWEPPSRTVEATVFAGFWDWLGEQRRQAADAGRSVVVYCWYRGAEARALRDGAEAAAAELGRSDDPDAVEAFLASEEFVDLWEVFSAQLITGGSQGLKTIAALAGFSWRDTDPDGALSMVWHAEATTHDDAATRAAAQARLLAYNEDDVRATAAVRTWLRALPLPHAPGASFRR